MTTLAYIQTLECFKKTLELNRPLAIAAQSAHASKCERIFTDGKNSAGGQIGEYSNEPTYINPDKSPKKFKAVGKHGKSVFASTGKPHKTRYFAGGQFEYKVTIGHNANFVNLTNFGDLKSNFENRSRGVPSPKKVSNDEYSTGLDLENSDKRNGIESKYGIVFNHTEPEKKEFYKTLGLELKNELVKCQS